MNTEQCLYPVWVAAMSAEASRLHWSPNVYLCFVP